MTLNQGFRLGPYEIVAPLGAGGMGEVYRARDSRLGREVAVKVLPAEVAGDAERLRRFEQEARSASALNHPNILTLFDVGELAGKPYLVMELLEGRSFREIVASGEAIQSRRVLDWGAQIARGLAAAHDKGIVHRDLKPENLFLTRDGVAKILDFGLAKLSAFDQEALAAAPTNAGATTGPGVILGTAGYMAPEQVRGQRVDARADVFALGCVLYELLGGRRAFQGDTSIETLNAILKVEPPPLSELKATVSPAVAGVVERCLAKDPTERFQSARDLGFALEAMGAASGSGFAAPAERTARGSKTMLRRLGVATIALAALAAGALIGRYLNRSAPGPLSRLRTLTYSGHDSLPAISPDGKILAFNSDRDGRSRIWIRRIGSGGEAPVTEGVDRFPRFFPDGESILYSHTEGGRNTLYRVALVGGQPRKLIEDADAGDVSPDGREISFVRSRDENGQRVAIVFLARADGSEVREIFRVGSGATLFFPRFSPDGRTLAVGQGGQAGNRASFYLLPLDGSAARQVPAFLPNAVISSVAWSGDGLSFFYMQGNSSVGGVAATEGQILRYDLASSATTPLLWTPMTGNTIALAGPGRLIFDGALPRENLRTIAIGGEPAEGTDHWLTRGFTTDRQPVVSPDGGRVVFSSNRTGNLDLWSLSLATGAAEPLTDDPADDWDPGFTPDGKHLLWSSNRSGSFEIWTADADGSHPRQITHDGDAENPTATPDGDWIVYASGAPANAGIWKIRADGSQPTQLAKGLLLNPELSPDGVYVAYRLVYPGRPRGEVHVLRFTDGAAMPFEIDAMETGNGQAARPRWTRDGKALAFVGADERGVQGIYIQDFLPGVDTSHSRRQLGGFDAEAPAESFGISRDGSRLVVASQEQSLVLMMAENVPGLEDRR